MAERDGTEAILEAIDALTGTRTADARLTPTEEHVERERKIRLDIQRDIGDEACRVCSFAGPYIDEGVKNVMNGSMTPNQAGADTAMTIRARCSGGFVLKDTTTVYCFAEGGMLEVPQYEAPAP
jgi:hypothetical protein